MSSTLLEEEFPHWCDFVGLPESCRNYCRATRRRLHLHHSGLACFTWCSRVGVVKNTQCCVCSCVARARPIHSPGSVCLSLPPPPPYPQFRPHLDKQLFGAVCLATRTNLTQGLNDSCSRRPHKLLQVAARPDG
jgi:hypothetical protein